MSVEVEVFADLTEAGLNAPALGELTSAWASPDSLGGVARDLSLVVPPGFEEAAPTDLPANWRWLRATPTEVCEQAFDRAVAAQVPILVLLKPVLPLREAIGVLLAALDRDPLFPFAHARIAEPERGLLLALEAGPTASTERLPRRILSELPEYHVTADLVTPCFVAHPSILELGLETSRSIVGALSDYMTKARRVGMRSLIANRAVVSLTRGAIGPLAMQLKAPAEEESRLDATCPGRSRMRRERDAVSAREELMARALSGRPSLLLDARNMIPAFNGTTQVTLGVLQGLQALDTHWDVEVWTHPEAARHHALASRFAPWPVRTKPPVERFSVGLRLSQPWNISEMIDLHHSALCNVYLMLDTIAWDVMYAAPPGLDGLWRFLSTHADGLAFISEYSAARFAIRFPRSEPRPRIAVPLSCDPQDYADDRAASSPEDGEYVFVVGNSLEHKDMARTTDLLRHAFPDLTIRALGLHASSSARVIAQSSGAVDELQVQRLYAGARAVVFPSYYEGFGFPVVTGLSYGRTVLARRSGLLEEVAAHYRGPGHLVPYRSAAELVRSLGALLHGSAPPSLTLGSALPPEGPPHDWRCVAREIEAFCARLLKDSTTHRWRERDDAIAQMHASR
jgi:glycosyltransferase involved in cell wall biosynthesis